MLPRVPVSKIPPGAPRPFRDEIRSQEQAMTEADKQKQEVDGRKQWARKRLGDELKHSQQNLVKIQESYVKIMRSQKTKSLKKEVDVVSQNHERDVDRKDAILQMLDRDLDEAEEQHQVGVRAHLQNVARLSSIQQARVEALHEEFTQEVGALESEFQAERDMMLERHALEKRELQLIVEQVDAAERTREQYDLTEFQGNFEMIRNRNIEEDHQMRSQLEEQIEAKRGRCNSQLVNYRTQTETNTQDYHTYLNRDAKSSKEVEQRLRQVERMQANIQQWKTKIQQNKSDCEERNAQLRTEKEQIQKHFQELKGRMNRFRAEQKKRLIDLTVNARNCQKAIGSQLEVAERVLKVSEACRKLETEHEKVMPFYLGREVDVDSLPLDDEQLKEEIKEHLADKDVDEWSYLDLYLKRYNKVQLDLFAVEKEKTHLDKENNQLRAILKQVLDGVSVNAEVLEQANPLLVVNGRVNLNHMPVTRKAQTGFVEAAHQVAAHQKMLVKA